MSPGYQPGRRKSSGGSTQLRSPVIKRLASSPVTLQGWLHKQGSEGLMLWKKRWFVLSEYCLFYYKTPDEEKLLGSILLPSYKVSPCTNEDKIYKKFAFKAEHANMRTYYFAADTRELMVQWMNALSLASILQEGVKYNDRPSVSYVNNNNNSISNNNAADDSDSGFRGYTSRSNFIVMQQPQVNNSRTQQYPSQVNPYQPLYANAPPKPKRLADGRYVSSSPEVSPDRRMEEMDNNKMYSNLRPSYDPMWQQQQLQQQQVQRNHYHPQQQRLSYGTGTLPSAASSVTIHNSGTYPGVDRRTPNSLARVAANRDDYFDVYKDRYNRPEPPQVTNYVRTVNPPIVTYQNHAQYYQNQPRHTSSSYQGVVNSNIVSKRNQPPRPHSADFLDYDSKKCYEYQEYKETRIVEKTDYKMVDRGTIRPQRPKSSLDIMQRQDENDDNYYLSEESYAERMRQSAMYLQQNSNRTPTGPSSDSSSVVTRNKQSGELERRTPNRQYNDSQSQRRWSENQFVRSASARLTKLQDDESDEVQAYTGGEDFKREESMKRLLEWKQRMLQSPLTRKSSGSASRGTSHNELSKYYKQQVMLELEKQDELSRRKLDESGVRLRSRSSDGRRSATASSNRYNSCSSDDEDKDESRRKRNRRPSQGGRNRRSTSSTNEENKTQTNKPSFVSPDYENLNPNQADEPTNETVQTGLRTRYKHEDSCSKHSDSGYDTLKTNTPQTLVTHIFDNCRDVRQNLYLLDETDKEECKIRKEFSYEYIKPKLEENEFKSVEKPPENIVKSRIKQLGLETEDKTNLCMKEPLKASPLYQPNEAHVSTLKNSDSSSCDCQEKKASLRKFALGEVTPTNEQPNLPKKSKIQKSVKDLLADFERKSLLAQEKEEQEKNLDEERRCVFSDTETLLYDTSSDVDEKRTVFDVSILDTLRRPESRLKSKELTDDEDGDEEVAAALGRRERFFSSCRDLGRKKEPDYYSKKKKTLLKNKITKSPEIETITTPGYLHSTLTEKIQDNSDTSCSPPVLDQIKDNLHMTLSVENTRKVDETNRSKEESENDIEMPEGHYMPMTPSRKVSSQNSDKSRSNSSLHSVLFSGEPEETYVEMTESSNNNKETNKSFLSNLRNNMITQENTAYYEIDAKSTPGTHYDVLYRISTQHEPEYMEVTNLLEILKEQDEKIKEHKERERNIQNKTKENVERKVENTTQKSALPDILNSSATCQVKSDSSDADDESSKDLDSLDTPRHPRFSLSDTFRPASYYLGNAVADRNNIGIPLPGEHHDSSDSDLVSPPSIPTSPPPLDDLDTSLEHDNSLDVKIHNNVKRSQENHEQNFSLWSRKEDSQQQQQIDLLMKRRPLSDDIIDTLNSSEQSFEQSTLTERHPSSDLESIGSRSGLVLDDDDIDKYLAELQISDAVNTNLYSHGLQERLNKSYSEDSVNNMLKGHSKKSETLNKEFLQLSASSYDASENLRQGESRRDVDVSEEEEVKYENLQGLFPPPPPELYETTNDHSDRDVPTIAYRDIPLPEEIAPPSRYEDTFVKTEPSRIRFNPDTLAQETTDDRRQVTEYTDAACQLENQTAPYYYSDLLKPEEDGFASSTSAIMRSQLPLTRFQQLNNQRDDIQESNQIVKRNDIGRKVNPINQSAASPSAEVEEMDYVQKITAELRQTSVHFMDAADKTGNVDVRNLYESDTLRRKINQDPVAVTNYRIRTPDLNHPNDIARNLYPHALRNKSPSQTIQNNSLRNRSRSLEGSLNEEMSTNVSNRNETPLVVQQQTSTSQFDRSNICDGDRLWEEDALWRERLRQASLRHTRSLDNLDEERTSMSRQVDNTSRHNLLTAANRSIGRSVEHVAQDDHSMTTGRQSVDQLEREQNSVPTIPTGRFSVDHFTPTHSNSSAVMTGRNSVDHFANIGRARLTREVTYVNDVLRPARQEYEQDYREGRVRPKKKEHTVIELSDSGLQECDDGVHYERLARNSESLERNRRGQTYLEGYEWDEDGETFRRNQREIIEKSPRARQPQTFLEDGNHPPQPPPQQPVSRQEISLELIDREKLRQWDLMSIGMVESDQGQKSTTTGTNQSETSEDLKQLHKKQIEIDLSPNSEASASGSVMKEAPMPRSMSSLSQSQVPLHVQQPQRTRQHRILTPTILLDKEDVTPTRDGGYNGQDIMMERTPNGYYDPNNFSPGYDVYQQKKYDSVPERRRCLSDRNNMHLDQYQDRVRSGYEYYPNHSSTLPVTKTYNSQHTQGYNRNTVDVRQYRGKENYQVAEKRDMTKQNPNSWGLDMSAGELLGRTHEELVLLLIQLRRQSAGVCKAMEVCHIEIDSQARLSDLDTPKRMEHLQKLEELKRHLLELEKQYEKGKPLVNLVDNMVKLGSLYRGGVNNNNVRTGLDQREKLEFNQKVQEQRLLAEERKDWDRLSPDHGQLQVKVQELYRLDRLLQEESGTLHSLRQDKELLEKALGGLKHKLEMNRTNPVEAERYRRQQKLLEKELSRVRLLLAHNSKKLEETVAENARLEQELVILRQKLSSYSRSSSAPLVPDSATINTTAALEAELRRVQQLVGDLQRQRLELSVQVRQLTEKDDVRPGPTGVAGAGPIPGKKKSSGTWLETDLDLSVTRDASLSDSPTTTSPLHHHQTPPKLTPSSPEMCNSVPIYINTDLKNGSVTEYIDPSPDVDLSTPTEQPPDYPPPAPPPLPVPSSTNDDITLSYCTPLELSEADDRTKRFYGIIPREKQEIKTVRIVKRESERRQRDRDRSGNIGIPTIGNTATAKRVTVIGELDNSLTRVEEEFGYIDNYQLNNDEPYKHFHPTNPFLPQNLANNYSLAAEDTVQRSMSLPRGFGKQDVEPPAPPIRDQTSYRNAMMRRNKVRFENHEGSGSEGSTNSLRTNSPRRNYSGTTGGNRQLTAREQLFGEQEQELSPQLSPVYQSEAARQIILEMSVSEGNGRRLQVPKEKRRHHTVSNIRHVLDNDGMGTARARDDLDMERALRPRINAPDVVRSTMSQKDLKYNENTIDNILGTPNKIVIPERYIPEQEPLLTAEEQLQRLRKAESIRKMLSETTAVGSPELNPESVMEEEEEKTSTLKKKVAEEKKQREHLLQLNQILAQQVMEKSKLVAVKALAKLPLDEQDGSIDDDDLSPIQPLPLYQQRENFYS